MMVGLSTEIHGTRVAPSLEGLRVDRLRVSVLEESLADPVPMSIGTLGVRRSLLVEVDIGGVRGLGETWVNHPEWAGRERLVTLAEGIAPALRGRAVGSPSEVLSELAGELLPRAAQGGVTGPVWQALSGLDLALWDAAGKLHGVSVGELLHPLAAPAKSVSVYASGIGPTQVERLCATAGELGVGAVKARVGFGADTDRRTLEAIRAALGEGATVFADANRAWSPQEADDMCRLLADHGVAWVEEPLRDDRPEELAALARRTGMALAAGENLYGTPAFEEQMAAGSLAVVQPDPAKSGGLTTCAEVAARAAHHGVDVNPHCYSGGVALAASVTFAASFHNVTMVEVDIRHNALRTELLDHRWSIQEGRLAVPTGPGLGVLLDEDVRARHLVAEQEIDLDGVRP